jgi:hypothetical protein
MKPGHFVIVADLVGISGNCPFRAPAGFKPFGVLEMTDNVILEV